MFPKVNNTQCILSSRFGPAFFWKDRIAGGGEWRACVELYVLAIQLENEFVDGVMECSR